MARAKKIEFVNVATGAKQKFDTEQSIKILTMYSNNPKVKRAFELSDEYEFVNGTIKPRKKKGDTTAE